MLYLLKTLFVIEALMVIGLVLFRWALAPKNRGIVSFKIVALALLTPAVALFSGNYYIFCGYLVLAVAFNSRSRSELAATYVFLLPLMPLLSLEVGVGGVYLFAVSALVAMNLGALIGLVVTSKSKTLTLGRYDLGIAVIAMTFVFIYNRDTSFTSVLRGFSINIIEFAGPYLLISRALSTRVDIERLLIRLCLGGTLTAVTALFQARWHWVVFEAYYQSLHVPIPMLTASLSLRAGLLRTGGSIVDYGAGGLFLALIVALMPFMRPQFRPIGFWVISLVSLGGLIASQSRGAWVAAIIGLLFVAAYRGLWARMALLAGSAIAVEIFILLFATTGRLAQIAGQTEEASGTVSYRKLLATKGMKQIQDHPLLGQSPDQLIANMPELVQGQHIVDFVNGHLFIAMAAGIPLFLIWCIIWLMPIVDAWRRRRQADNIMEAPAVIIVTALTALIFTSIVDRNLTWASLAFGLAAPCMIVARRRLKANAKAAALTQPLLNARLAQ
jgi:O-antigen ligase